MYAEDLSSSCQIGQGRDIRAIGWLDAKHSYTKGKAPSSFLACLRRHVEEAWEPFVAMGVHKCELCQIAPPFMCGSNLWIPSAQILYLAPGMIVHYIEAHQYCPPQPFIEAVLTCPRQATDAYHAAMQPFEHHWHWR